MEWGSPTSFTLIGGACVQSVITFGTPRLASITMFGVLGMVYAMVCIGVLGFIV